MSYLSWVDAAPARAGNVKLQLLRLRAEWEEHHVLHGLSFVRNRAMEQDGQQQRRDGENTRVADDADAAQLHVAHNNAA